MLVLTRRRGESIRVGDSIVVTVCEIRDKNYVRIGIEAPRDVNIVRTEIDNRRPIQESETSLADLGRRSRGEI